MATLAASPYAAAKLVASEAKIDPDAHSAELSVDDLEADRRSTSARSTSGPRPKYSPALVRNLRDDPRRATCTASARSTTTCGGCWRPAISRACRRRSTPTSSRPTHATVHAVGDRGADQAPRVRRRLLDRHAIPGQRQLQRRQHRRPRTADVRRARASRRRSSRQTCASCGRPRRRLDRHLRDRRRSAPTSRTSSRARRRSRRGGAPSTSGARPRSASASTSTSSSRRAAPTEYSHALYVDGEYTWRNVDNLLDADARLDGQRAGRRRRSRRVDASASAA